MYRQLVENASDMLSLHDPDGTYQYASPQCRALLGYEPHELVGRSAYELFHPDDIAANRGSHEHLLRDGAHRIELRLRRKDGSYV